MLIFESMLIILLKRRFAKKGQTQGSTPEPFLGQNELFVETKRKKQESTPEIQH